MRLWLMLILTFLLACPVWGQTHTGKVEAVTQTRPSVTAAWFEWQSHDTTPPADAQALKQWSVRVWPASSPQDDASALPARLEMDAQGTRIVWRVPGATRQSPAGQTQAYVYAVTRQPAGDGALPESILTNLIDNGDFSELDANGMPVGISPRHFRDVKVVQSPQGNHLVFGADDDGRGPSYVFPYVELTPGQSYEVSFRYRVDQGKAHPLYNLTMFSWFNFYDKDYKHIGRASVITTRVGDTEGWRTAQTVLAAPPNAAHALMDIRNASSVPGSVKAADVRITPTTWPRAIPAGAQEATAAQAKADLMKFTFGPDGIAPWHDFQAVTPKITYDAQRGWGFARLAGPRALDHRKPDALLAASVSAGDARFRVDLPDGEYQLWFLWGETSSGVVRYYYFNQHLEVNGQAVHTFDPKPSEYVPRLAVEHYEDFWLPGMDYYETFIAPLAKQKQARVQVTGGKLEVRWRNLPLAALMIAPADQAGQLDQAVARVMVDRRRETLINEAKPEQAAASPQAHGGGLSQASQATSSPLVPTQAEETRGFAFYRQPPGDKYLPWQQPREDQRIEALETFAAPGQVEPLWLSIYALRDGGEVRLVPGVLKSGSHTLDPKVWDVRVARYIFRDARARGEAGYRYALEAFPLDHRDKLPLAKGLNWTWCATVNVPPGTPAGVYTGQVQVVGDSGPLASMPVRVRVLPYELAPLPITQGYYYFPLEPWYGSFWTPNIIGTRLLSDPAVLEVIKKQERRELAFMKSLGLNSVAFGDDLRGAMVYEDGQVNLKENDRFSLWMDLYKEADMGPMPFYGFQPIGFGSGADGANNRLSWLDPSLKQGYNETWIKAYRSFIINTQKIARERNWPEILWYISDERSNYGRPGAETGRLVAQAAESIPGIRTIASFNGPHERIMAPHVSIAMPNLAYPITEETLAHLEEVDSEFWIYNCGDQRIALGLWPWRVGAKGRFQWHYRSMLPVAWDDMRGPYGLSRYDIAYPGPDGPVGTLRSESVRATITDHRYIATLEQRIAQVANDPAKAGKVKQAQAFIEELRARLPVDPRAMQGFQVDPREAGGALGGEFRHDDAVQRVRWAIAQYILELQ